MEEGILGGMQQGSGELRLSVRMSRQEGEDDVPLSETVAATAIMLG